MAKEIVVVLLILTLIVICVSYFAVAFEYHIQETKELTRFLEEREKEREKERMRERKFWSR